MAGPPIPPNPVPAINKVYTDIKFFLKNAATTKAFEEISFTGTSDGYPDDPEADEPTLIPYPNEDFDNTDEGVPPFIDLTYLSAAYEIKIPELLDTCTIEADGRTITASSEVFNDIPLGTYLLYKGSGEDENLDNLKVLGWVDDIDGDQAILVYPAPLDAIELGTIFVFSWPGDFEEDFTVKDLNALSFNFQDSFYMVVKNTDYTTGNHDGILLIDRTKTNFTIKPEPFAYSSQGLLNPNYFSLQRISKVFNPSVPETNQNGDPIGINIPCSIKGVSKWSEGSMFTNTNITSGDNRIPFWSVYEITPNLDSVLDKKSFYRLTINNTTLGGLPSSRVFNNFTPIE